ncbi:MAG: hypothetical protein ACLFT5_03010, partial [Desulfovermiculus sp.]
QLVIPALHKRSGKNKLHQALTYHISFLLPLTLLSFTHHDTCSGLEAMVLLISPRHKYFPLDSTSILRLILPFLQQSGARLRGKT